MLTHALLLVPIGALLGATRDVRGSISPRQIRTALRQVGPVAAIALTLTALLGATALVIAWSLRPIAVVADGALIVLSAIAAHLALLMVPPVRDEIGASHA